jgi:predicted RNA-binding Zn-ribbon protein involved in translation (DUF1610 family)
MTRRAITEAEAKGIVEKLMPYQEAGEVFPCPRCGHNRMHPEAVRNALSRRAQVYVCTACGVDEAMMDAVKAPPMPFSQWGMVLGMTRRKVG